MFGDEYACDLIGGPHDGETFVFPTKPAFLYFPVVEQGSAVQNLSDEPPLPPLRKAVYVRSVLGLYIYKGVEK